MIAFKYRACKDENGMCRDIDMLLKDQIYASPISQLNDCFEGRYLDDDIDKQLSLIATVTNYDVTKIKSQWIDFKRAVNATGVYSMSLSDVCFPNNKVLWSLYAGEYSGFCVAYDIDELVKSEQFPWLVNRLKVVYMKNIPKVALDDVFSRTQLLQKMIGTKDMDWAQEKEYRVVYDESGVKTYNRRALKAVYLGFRMTDIHKKLIIDGLQGRDVDIYEMVPMTGSYDFKADLKFSLRRIINDALKDDEYEIIDTYHRPKVENFYVFYKGTDRSENKLITFVNKFREMYATMDANVELYDSVIVKPLLKKDLLNDTETKIMKDHFIGFSSFDAPDCFVF